MRDKVNKHFSFIALLLMPILWWTACKNDVNDAGISILDDEDAIVVKADTFAIFSEIEGCESIISKADSFLLGEIETDYGLLRASILTQLACPEGYTYPEGAEVDSVCLYMYYSSWVGDGNSPIAINAYQMDKGTFHYSATYPTDVKIEDYCSRDICLLKNHRIVVATEKMDSILNTNNQYMPMVRMRLNDDFKDYFWGIQSFNSQEEFNQKFQGLLIETSFGSSTVLNISDVALGVYYHFTYSKAGNDTTVSDMKAFYANAEVRTVNPIRYQDKTAWIDALKADSNEYNYIIAPAGVYTRLSFPMAEMVDTVVNSLIDSVWSDELKDYIYWIKRPYVNLAQVRVDVENVFSGSSSDMTRNDWLQPAKNMLLIKENSVKRFFDEKELPSDTCALLSSLTQGVDSTGNTIYYYSYDMSDFFTDQLRKLDADSTLTMLLVPVTVTSNSSGTVSSVREQQTISATKIRSAKNGMTLKMVYSGF